MQVNPLLYKDLETCESEKTNVTYFPKHFPKKNWNNEYVQNEVVN